MRMPTETWTAVDKYIDDTLRLSDSALEGALASSRAAGLPEISVTAPQGKLLYLLARLVSARNILEVGTLGGYSAIWMARALPDDGRLVTLEVDDTHAAVARSNFSSTGLGARIELRVGPALETLPRLAAEGAGPFDLTFIDADKPSNPHYLEWAIKLSRPGSLIVIDNVVRNGAVLLASSNDAGVQGVRRVMEMLAGDRRLAATAIQTVGSKGYDGFAMALVVEPG